MRSTFIIFLMLTLFSTIVAVVSGCDETLEFANTPPGGLVIDRDRYYLGPQDYVTLTGQATDADGDSISYSWTAEAGTLSPADGRGRIVTWRAPDSYGTYRLTLKASDGLDSASKGMDIDVGRHLDIQFEGGVLDKTDYPYIVPNALPMHISELITVSIEAGVTIVFNERTGGLSVRGTLIINGTEHDRVLFTPNIYTGVEPVWGGVVFSGSEAAGTLSYLTLTSAANGLTVEDGAVVAGTNIIVDQTSGDGVSVESGGSLNLSDSKIWDSKGGGIYVANGMLLIQDSSIRYNGNYGFSMISNTGPFDVTVLNCVVADNEQYGFVLASVANPVVNNCSMFLNGPSGADGRTLMLSTGYANMDTINMTGNYWGATKAFEIEAQIDRGGSSVEVDYSGWLTEPPVHD